MRKIMEIYNQIGDDDKTRFTDYHNAVPYPDARKYLDKDGVEYLVQRYLKHLANARKGVSCEKEKYTIPGVVGKGENDIVYDGLKQDGDKRKASNTRLEFDDDSSGGFDVNGAFTIESTTGGVTASFNQDGTRLKVNGTGTVTLKYNWNDIPGYKSKALESISIGNQVWTQANVKHGTEVHTLTVNSVTKSAQTKERRKAVTPLTEEQYIKYKNDFSEVEPISFECLRKDIWRGIMDAARKDGPIVLEQTYCDWARQYVEEVRTTWRPAKTIGYELPCGGEITAPREDPTPPVITSDPKILTPKQVKINTTGVGYTPNDKILIDGDEVPFDVDPNGRITSVTPPNKPVFDYPEIDIITDTGAGADLEVLLKVEEPPEDPALRPLEMIEVIDCVGKNIFIKES